MQPSSKAADVKTCIICYDNINSQTAIEGEKERVLDCSHIFHRECIGEWLNRRHNCPVCRAHVEVSTPESKMPEMSAEEIAEVPDRLSNAQILRLIRSNIREIRRVRRLNLQANTPVSNTAKKVNLEISRRFGW